VKRHFDFYGGLVRKEGIIAFHDVVLGLPQTVGGVPKFWREIKSKFKNIEIVKNRKRGWEE
jgi:hypothetical protein